MAYEWLSAAHYREHVDALRERVSADAATVLVFLGAGLSFGVGRFLGRASFERPEPWDDQRFPSWPDLIARMKRNLLDRTADETVKRSYEGFFDHNDYLDCAQLFSSVVGHDEYADFLRSQFHTVPVDRDLLTPSHTELVRLPVRELFTTNYDSLIELAFRLDLTGYEPVSEVASELHGRRQ